MSDISKFRKELKKIMPGYKWTVHKPKWTVHKPNYSGIVVEATGIMSSGFNRMSTLMVTKRKKGDSIQYNAKSSGFGSRAPWLSEYNDVTLSRTLRGLQNHYKQNAANYYRHAADLESGRVEDNQE